MLTKREIQVMNVLWDADTSLSCAEIITASGDKAWKDSYVHSLVKSLIKKGIVKIESFELISRSYARKISPRLSREEYALKSACEDLDADKLDIAMVIIGSINNESSLIEIKKSVENKLGLLKKR